MSSTDQGVRRTERYLYGSLHQAFPLLPAMAILASFDSRNATPASWVVAWSALVAAASWASLTVLHTRLRDLGLLPATGWDRWFHTRHRTGVVVAWVVLSLAATACAGLFAPTQIVLLVTVCALLGGMFSLPVLVVGVTSIASFPAGHLRTAISVLAGAALSVVALWAMPTGDPDAVQARLASTLITAWIAGITVGFGSMFLNVIGATRALEKARVDEARLAVAEERVRFARDLHDVFGRTLSAVALKSELAAAQAERGRPEAAATMREVQAIAAGALTEVREVVRGYREADLAAELAGARSLLESAGIGVSTVVDSAPLPPPVARSFAWVVREATTNALRHARATHVQLALIRDASGATLTVANDGVPVARPVGAGSGLAGLAERLAEVDGVLDAGVDGDRWVLRAHVDAATLARLDAAGSQA